MPTSQAFGPWFALDKQSLSHTRIRPLQTGASSGLIIAPCAGHGIAWACPYSPLANRGTQQPVFSLRVPLSFFLGGCDGNVGSAALFVLGAALLLFSWTILTWMFGTLWRGTSRNPKLF